MCVDPNCPTPLMQNPADQRVLRVVRSFCRSCATLVLCLTRAAPPTSELVCELQPLPGQGCAWRVHFRGTSKPPTKTRTYCVPGLTRASGATQDEAGTPSPATAAPSAPSSPGSPQRSSGLDAGSTGGASAAAGGAPSAGGAAAGRGAREAAAAGARGTASTTPRTHGDSLRRMHMTKYVPFHIITHTAFATPPIS